MITIRDRPLQNQSEGTPDARYFGDFEYDLDDGPYEAIDHAWTRTFHFEYSNIPKEALVTGGQYGIRMVYMYLMFFAKLPTMEANELDYVLLGANMSKWDPGVEKHGRILLNHLYNVYSDESLDGAMILPKPGLGKSSSVSSIFAQAIKITHQNAQKTGPTELETYFSGTYPCTDGNALEWYKVHVEQFRIIS
ncbi:hypothetical protein K439DRAFT_1622742 [Ramaria rubella]|nr:hypothetical protein K439DRAFT_1622742 [Ramaria rubella]